MNRPAGQLAEADADLERLKNEAADGPDLRLERRIPNSIDPTTVEATRRSRSGSTSLPSRSSEKSSPQRPEGPAQG